MSRAGCAWATALLIFSKAAGAANLEVLVRTPDGRNVGDSAVVLESPGGRAAERPRPATIEQQGREFIPFLTIVQTGAAIDFPNRDPVKHHVYSFSRAKPFELKLYSGMPEKPLIFDKPGEVALGCNIHDWMEAYILVVNTPYFAKTNADGRASIANLPPGRYRLRLWHPLQKKEVAQRDIDIGTTTGKLELTIDVATRIAKPKPPLEADSY